MWVSREEFNSLSNRVSELEDTVSILKIRTGDYPVYSSDFSSPPLARVALWDMIVRILRHLELEIEAKPSTWEFVKRKPSKIAK